MEWTDDESEIMMNMSHTICKFVQFEIVVCKLEITNQFQNCTAQNYKLQANFKIA